MVGRKPPAFGAGFDPAGLLGAGPRRQGRDSADGALRRYLCAGPGGGRSSPGGVKARSVSMSSVANMIATIEDKMDVESEATANPEHLRMVEALLFAAS